MKTLLLAMVLAGCGAVPELTEYPMKPGQIEATALVWYDTLGMTVAPPDVEWMENERVAACPNGIGTGFMVRVGDLDLCAGGWTYGDQWLIRLMWLGSFSANEFFSHELAHAMLWVTTGTGDGGVEHENSTGPLWGPGGLVAAGTAALATAGL